MKKHPFDPISFLFGLVFAVVGIVFIVGDVNIAEVGWRWVWPLPVLFLGALLLTLAMKRSQTPQPVPIPEPDSDIGDNRDQA